MDAVAKFPQFALSASPNVLPVSQHNYKACTHFFPSCHFHLMMVNRKIIFNIASLFFSLSKSAKCENYWITMIICRVLIAARFWMLYKFVLCNSFTHFNKFTFWEQKKFSWRNGKLNFMIFFAARTLSFHKNRENMSAKKHLLKHKNSFHEISLASVVERLLSREFIIKRNIFREGKLIFFFVCENVLKYSLKIICRRMIKNQ